jgi:DNA-binding NarL/FixJ family response regulator
MVMEIVISNRASAAPSLWQGPAAVPALDRAQVWVHYGDPLLRAGLTAALQSHPGLDINVAETAAELDVAIRAAVTEVVVTDYEQGMQVLRDARGRAAGLRRKVPHAPNRSQGPNVLILTRRDSEGEIRQALQQGAHGYLTLGFTIEELIEAIGALRRGLRHIGSVAARRLADSIACEALTEREVDVLRLVSRGHSNKAVARELDIASGTVKSHLKAVFQKLNARTRTEVAAVAGQRGLLTTHGEEGDASASSCSARATGANEGMRLHLAFQRASNTAGQRVCTP